MPIYTEEQEKEIFDTILADMTEGKALRKCIKEAGISTATFYTWMNKVPDRLKQYARAHEIRAEIMASEILEIADDSSQDVINSEKLGPIENKEFINRSRVRIDSRKWLMSKMLPKKYGDSLKLQGDPDNPIESKLTIEIIQSDSARIATNENEIEE